MNRTTLSIRSQIVLVLLACYLIVLGVLVMGVINMRYSAYTADRAHVANHQLQAMIQLAVASNRHSEQIAEHLLLGRRERADLDRARAQMAEALGRLKRLIEEEIALVRDPQERLAETEELDRVEEMRAKFVETDSVVQQILTLQQSGQTGAAIALFGARIEDGLDDELEGIINIGIAGEQKEVASAEAEALSLARRLIWTMAGLSLLAVAGATAAGYYLYRSVANPLAALTAGAQAIAQGKLGYRIGTIAGSEFGFVAKRFDEMTEELERQHRQLLEAHGDLERKVARRTEELHEANTRLIELDRQRVSFLADASHELRTPLTVLRGEADLALRSHSKSHGFYRDALDRIVAQAEDMSRLVDDLLFLARSESDDVHFEMARIDLVAVVAEAAGGIAALARRRDISLHLAGDGTAQPIIGDPRRLKQAITIILENAIKYSPSRSRIDIGINLDNGGETTVMVHDTGIGISASDLPHVFDRFFRGEEARAKSGGSGLGLTIARWIVEKHGGRIEIASAAAQGTDARIILPAKGLDA